MLIFNSTLSEAIFTTGFNERWEEITGPPKNSTGSSLRRQSSLVPWKRRKLAIIRKLSKWSEEENKAKFPSLTQNGANFHSGLQDSDLTEESKMNRDGEKRQPHVHAGLEDDVEQVYCCCLGWLCNLKPL